MSEFDNYPKLSQRHIPVYKAQTELLGFLIELQQKYKLTITECLILLNMEISSYLGMCLRHERKDKDE